MKTLIVLLGTIAVFLGTAALLALVSSVVVYLAWNHAVPSTFGLPELTLLKAFCLSLCANLLIRSSSPNNGAKTKD